MQRENLKVEWETKKTDMLAEAQELGRQGGYAAGLDEGYVEGKSDGFQDGLAGGRSDALEFHADDIANQNSKKHDEGYVEGYEARDSLGCCVRSPEEQDPFSCCWEGETLEKASSESCKCYALGFKEGVEEGGKASSADDRAEGYEEGSRQGLVEGSKRGKRVEIRKAQARENENFNMGWDAAAEFYQKKCDRDCKGIEESNSGNSWSPKIV